jgi:uncharacterized protein YraI
MMRMRFSGFFIAAGLLCSAAVCAQEAYTTKAVNLRAGPDRDYPLVAQLAPGTPVTVAGCVSDYRWCDVIYGDTRGWVYANSLQYPYQNQQVPIYGYGAAIGLPIVTFSVLSYWDSYYRSRPFYRDRPRWENRPYRAGPRFVAPPRVREQQFRQPRPIPPQIRPVRPVQPQYRPPRVERPLAQPQMRPQVQPHVRPPGGHEGNRPAPGGERRTDRTPSR